MVKQTNPNEPKEEKDGLTEKPKKDYRLIIRNIIHQKYSPDDIEALIRHYNAEPEKYSDKFKAYNTFCEEVVARVKAKYGIKD